MVAVTKWVFLDVGNVLFYDAPVLAFIYELIYQQIKMRDASVSFSELLAERERLISQNRDARHYATLGQKYLGQTGWQQLRQQVLAELERNYLRYHFPLDGIEEVLSCLAPGYKLGVAANQVSACRQALKSLGFSDYFSIIWLSEEVGMAKPDIRFFETLLEQAGCAPEEALMIGDLPANDIAPANSLGMKTIWARFKLDCNDFAPETECRRQYLESHRRIDLTDLEPVTSAQQPTLTVTSLREIPDAVIMLNREK